MSELIFRPTKTRRGSAEAQEIPVVHFAEPHARFFESEWLESYGAHNAATVLRHSFCDL
jgi:hypothetical protein